MNIKTNNKKDNVWLSVITLLIVSDPSPITSGKKIPKEPHNKAGNNGL